MMMANSKDVNTLLLMHFNNTYEDSCGNSITNTNNLSSISYENAKFETGISSSGTDTGNQCYLYYNKIINPEVTPITIDFYMKRVTNGANTGVRLGSKINANIGQDAQLGFNFNNSGYIMILIANSSYTSWSTALDTGVAIPSDGLFHHVAITYNSGTCKIYVDGVHKYIRTLTLPATQNGTVAVLLDHYDVIDELRISNVVRWTTNFTPPTSPYTI